MLGGMVLRMQIELRDEDVEPLRESAWNDHRTIREQASFLLHLKIQEKPAGEPAPTEAVA